MRGTIIIPFRNRSEHLKIFLQNIFNHFDGNIYVAEQVDEKGFNLGKLINCAFNEFKKEFDYFIIHDVDAVPEKVDYSYSIYPTHLGTQVEQFGYMLPYPKFFGSVILMANPHFEMINGYDNNYFYWGGDDDELRRRLEAKLIPIERRQCRFKSLPHDRNIDNEMRMKNVSRLKSPIDWSSGLSDCRYEIINCEEKENHTLLQVSL